jgi:hypothetical protein
MARIRSIKPTAFTSESMASVSVPARWTFAGLWTYCDDDGRGRADPRLIKGQLWPLDDDVTSADVTSYMDELEKEDMLCRYSVDGRAYLHVVHWTDHQAIQKKTRSKLPPCPVHDTSAPPPAGVQPPSSQTPVGLQEDYGSATGSGTEPDGSSTQDVEEGYRGEQGTGNREQGEETSSSPGADAPADHDPQGSLPIDKPDPNDRADVRSLCDLLASLMVGNGCKPPKIGKEWLDECRRMIDIDKREPAKAAELIRWCQKDSFWRSNIQSMPTFRAKYDRIRLLAIKEWESTRGSDGRSGLRVANGNAEYWADPANDYLNATERGA